MTTRDIMQMTPAELREAIAKAKGYECKHGYMDKACINPKDYWVTPEGRLTSVLPDWPTDIADAWNLVEEIRAHGDEIRLDTDRNGSGEDVITVVALRFRGDGRGTGWNSVAIAEAPTPALAICRAWLMWKDGDYDPR